jgi:cation diffusion facilitator family transporter
VQAGYAFVDPLVAILIVVVIAWTAFVVLQDVLSSLTDAIRLDPEEVRTTVMSISGVLNCHDIRTRGLAHHVFMDLSIHVDPTLSVEKAHTLATRIEECLIDHFESLEDVVVHIEPEGHDSSRA